MVKGGGSRDGKSLEIIVNVIILTLDEQAKN